MRAWLVFLVACGSSTPTSEEPATDFVADSERCESDAECVISDFPGCCDCCSCSSPYAIRADALEEQQRACESEDCSQEHEEQECAIVECQGCPTTHETFDAVCEEGRCVRQPG